MSSSWSRQIGSLVGGSLAGPAGAIIGGIATSILGQAIDIDDPIRDALRGVVGEQVGELLGTLNPEQTERINHDLQEAFRDAFCEALYDIGGEACFAHAWQAASRDVPPDVVYSLAKGHELWQRNDPLAQELCDALHETKQAVDDLLPFAPPNSSPAANVMTYLAADTPQELEEAFFRQVLADHLKKFAPLWNRLQAHGFYFERHLRHYFFDRLLIHLGEHLKQRTPAWRAFNRFLLEEIRLRVRHLDSGQAEILQQLAEIRTQLTSSSQNGGMSSLTDQLAELVTAIGEAKTQQNQSFDRLFAQHQEVIAQLSGLARISETSKQTFTRVDEVGKDVKEVAKGVDEVAKEVEEVAKGVKEVKEAVHLLRQPASSVPTAPFTAPKPPKQFVQRPAEFDELINLLLSDGTQRTITITTALQGGGGFGKTTLAQAICHDERIKNAFPDGVLWVTIGQTPNLVELLVVQIKYFAPEEQYTDINAAQYRLRALLAGKRVLVVLDDVWQESHARAFVQRDSPTCAHLITTRQQEIARWLQAQTVTVNEMQTSQAVDLLIKWLAGTKEAQKLARDKTLRESLQEMAGYLGEWPLLLELAGAELRELVQVEQLALAEAIHSLRQALQEEGFTVFDREDEQERNRAISISLSISLKRLGKWRQRFMELAIFPEDTDIPHATIFKLWAQTGQLSAYRAKKALRAMRDLSLFTRYDAEKQTVRLHDVIGAYLAEQQAERLPSLHQQFLSAYKLTHWANLPPDEPYLWHHLAYHLHEGQQNEALRALLLDFAWMNVKLHATDSNALLADYDKLPNDEFISHIQRVLRQASHILAENYTQLAGQLWGRLTEEERAQLSSLPQSGASLPQDGLSSAWLRPLHPSLRSSRALLRTFAGHSGPVTAVAVSEDRRWTLSCSSDHTVKVWDLMSGQERLTFTGHTAGVTGVAVSGRWALSCSYDKTVKVWDWGMGQERLTFTGHTSVVTGVAVSGRWALSCSHDKTVKVWDWGTGQERLTFTGHSREVIGVALSGRWAFSCSVDKTVKVWDLMSGQERLTFTGHTSYVYEVALSGRWALSCSDDKTVKVWDLMSGQERLTFTGHSDRVKGVVVSGNWALSCSFDRTVKVWDLMSGQERLTFTGHPSGVLGVMLSGRWALTCSSDYTVKVWDWMSRQERLTSIGHSNYVAGIALSGCWALTCSWDETVKVWNWATGQERLIFTGHTGRVAEIALSGCWALTCSWDETVKVWEWMSGQERLTFTGHSDRVTGVVISGRWVLSSSFDKTVKVWDLSTGHERLTFAGHSDRVTGVAVSEDGRWALSCSQDKTVKVWDVKTGQERLTFTGHNHFVTGVALSGRWALSCSWDKTVKVWDIKTGQERLTFTGHSDRITGVAVSADGRWALSCSYDRSVKVWQLADGQVLASFDAGETLTCCAFAEDGRTIVAGGVSGRVHVLRLEGVDEL